MITVPCKDCSKRNIYCHTNCEEYKAYKKEMEKANKEADRDKISRSCTYLHMYGTRK